MSDRHLVSLVSSCVDQSKGRAEMLRDLLVKEAQLDVGVAGEIAEALLLDRGEERLSKRQRVAVVEQQEPQQSNEDLLPVAEETEAVLDDPVVAAKAGLFEKFKDNPVYMAQLREEQRRQYLKEREEKQLELHEKLIADRKQQPLNVKSKFML